MIDEIEFELKKKKATNRLLRMFGMLNPPSRKGIPSPRKGVKLSDETKQKIRMKNLGKHHTQATKDKCRKIAFEKHYGKWMIGKTKSLEARIKVSNMLKGKMPKNTTYTKYGNIKKGYYLINGKNMFFRSGWEANYALYLDWLIKLNQIKNWEYEKDVFVFEKIQFGNRSYRPDFKIFKNDDTIEYHEVKGWMDKKSKTKLNRMKKYYPEIKVVLIDSKFYRSIKKNVGKIIGFF
jgi:hypothetical protein